MVGFLDLPNEILLHIIDFLSYRDLQRFSSVNWRCNKLAATDEVWEKHCKKFWVTDGKTHDTWNQTFVEHIKEYGRYIDCYAEMIIGWRKLSSILQKETPEIFQSLKDGMTEEELDNIENEIGIGKFPPTLRLFYRLCGGQNINTLASGLMGGFASTHGLNTYYILPPTAEEDDTISLKNDEGPKFHTMALASDSYYNRFCIVIPKEGKENFLESEDVPPAYSIVWKCMNHVFKAAPNFQSWFLDHVENIVSGVYAIEHGHILRYLYEPDCVARTGPIEVRAGWVISQVLHTNKNLLFEYRIVLAMDEDADPRQSCQLLMRHWIITHAISGREERVSGPGVVGKFPVMKPGTKFSWMSRTYFSSPGGSMGGHFTMRSLLNEDNTLEIECPVYNMTLPHEYGNWLQTGFSHRCTAGNVKTLVGGYEPFLFCPSKNFSTIILVCCLQYCKLKR